MSPCQFTCLMHVTFIHVHMHVVDKGFQIMSDTCPKKLFQVCTRTTLPGVCYEVGFLACATSVIRQQKCHQPKSTWKSSLSYTCLVHKFMLRFQAALSQRWPRRVTDMLAMVWRYGWMCGPFMLAICQFVCLKVFTTYCLSQIAMNLHFHGLHFFMSP